jgi:hypothetical protein
LRHSLDSPLLPVHILQILPSAIVSKRVLQTNAPFILPGLCRGQGRELTRVSVQHARRAAVVHLHSRMPSGDAVKRLGRQDTMVRLSPGLWKR